nr:13416_t:CDS:2 [Entrophospora candida]
MVNNQIEFNKKYPIKGTKEIEITRNRNFQGPLVVEDYHDLEKLNLREVKKLVIENCFQIKNLNVRRNLLTGLEFIKDLNNLETLELDDLRGSDKNTQELLRKIRILEKAKNDLSINFNLSQKKYNDLKNFLKETLISLSKEAKEELVNKLNKKIETKEDFFGPGKTGELMTNVEEVIKSVEEIKKELEAKVQKLEKELAEAKNQAEEREKRFEELKELVVATKQKQTSAVQTTVYKETLEFLRTKSTFLDARRQTINELENRCNDLEEFLSNKNAKFGIIGDAISDTGGAASSTTIFGIIPKGLGEFIKAKNELSKIKFLVKSSEEFQIVLKNENELTYFEKNYDHLIDFIHKNGGLENLEVNILNLKDKQVYGKSHLFNESCEIFSILESKGVWEGKLLNSEAMKTAIMSLCENLNKELEKE